MAAGIHMAIIVGCTTVANMTDIDIYMDVSDIFKAATLLLTFTGLLMKVLILFRDPAVTQIHVATSLF